MRGSPRISHQKKQCLCDYGILCACTCAYGHEHTKTRSYIRECRCFEQELSGISAQELDIVCAWRTSLLGCVCIHSRYIVHSISKRLSAFSSRYVSIGHWYYVLVHDCLNVTQVLNTWYFWDFGSASKNKTSRGQSPSIYRYRYIHGYIVSTCYQFHTHIPCMYIPRRHLF